jgi:hypothetical protein
MKKWQIQTRLCNDEWECPEDAPVLYATKEEAQIELEDHISDMKYAFEMGYMEDYSANDWRVAQVDS